MVTSIDTNTVFVSTYNDQDLGDLLYRSPGLPADFIPLTDRDDGSPCTRSTPTAAQTFNHPTTTTTTGSPSIRSSSAQTVVDDLDRTRAVIDTTDEPPLSSDPNIECAKPEPSFSSSSSSADVPR